MGLGTFFFSFKKEITMAVATVVRFDNLVTNFLKKKKKKFYLVYGIILQISMVLRIVSLFDSGHSTDT